MTNEQLAELRDPERRMPGWWRQQQKRVCRKCGSDTKIVGLARICASMTCLSDSLKLVPHGTPTYTGPDWHADDDACFRDWSPVLLAAGCDIWHHEKRTVVRLGPDEIAVTEWEIVACSTFHQDGEGHYRAAILAAVAWLAEHKPTLLREAIAQVEEGL